MNHSRSMVMNELMHLGLTLVMQGIIVLQLNAGVTVGYLVSIIFILIGIG